MNQWLPQSRTAEPYGCTLYCLPHAGGGSAVYHRWDKLVKPGIRIRPIKLPGRESRWKEPPLEKMDDVVDGLLQYVMPEIEGPFAIYGHSMGGIMAFEFAQALAGFGLIPKVFFVSAARAPHLVRCDEPLHELPDDEMLSKLVQFYRHGEEVTEDEWKMMRLMVNTIRADLKLLENYRYRERSPLECPVVAVAATEDHRVTAAEMNPWKQHTSARFTFRSIPGHHFFLREQEQALVRMIENKVGVT